MVMGPATKGCKGLAFHHHGAVLGIRSRARLESPAVGLASQVSCRNSEGERVRRGSLVRCRADIAALKVQWIAVQLEIRRRLRATFAELPDGDP
jgi:hypothetical protein